MSDRPLSAGEKALWQKFIETVEPLDGTRPKRVKTDFDAHESVMRSDDMIVPSGAKKPIQAVPLRDQKPLPDRHGLDGHWDRRLIKGAIQPDVTVDLHGHSLSSAYGRLDSALELSIAAGHRAILLITGKARSEHQRRTEGGRGAIRAAIADWLTASRHATNIAAVRRAHPRHGGAGALYIILRRRR